ncbi:MAG TPA: GGDEF and EAL domain-containing protein [Stellaceae bacterium]|nr:GGDEF and EAL domain-containing protein [Stellaceae bacterium]
MEAALTAAGDIAYDWHVPSDRIVWRGQLGETVGITDPDALATGKALTGRINPTDLPTRQQRLNDHFAGAAMFDCDYRLRGEDGRFHWVQDRGRAEHDETGQVVRVVGIMRVITSRKALEFRLERLANFDELTGLANKLRLRDAIRDIAERSVATGRSGAYLAIGIDKMTMINDAFGCEAADAVLVEVGRRLGRCLTPDDMLGRVGGDRFGMLLADCGEARIANLAEPILAVVSEAPIFTAAGPIYITISIGSVAFPRQASTAEDIMTRAETALAEAKHAGRDCLAAYRLTEPQRNRHRASMAIAERVQRALKEGRLLFAFQPVVAGRSGAIDYYECLLRMRDDDGTIVAASQFVPAIEQLGFIRTIDRFVLERAIEELDSCDDTNLGLNISGLSAADQPWLRALVSLVASRPDIARRLVVEITETAALRDLEESARFVKTVRDLGCRVALDDFGAGFTSLRHLQTLALDIVKIDGSFVRDLIDRPDNQTVLRHLLGLASGLGLTTVAEWVETAAEAALLRQQGVDLLQGYHLGKPTIDRPWKVKRVAKTRLGKSDQYRIFSSAAC